MNRNYRTGQYIANKILFNQDRASLVTCKIFWGYLYLFRRNENSRELSSELIMRNGINWYAQSVIEYDTNDKRSSLA